MAILGQGGFSLLSGSVFVLVASVLYLRPLFENYPTKYAFAILLPLTIIAIDTVQGTLLFLPMVLVLAILFYWILGIKDFIFVKRSRIYYAIALSMLYLIFLLFFASDRSLLFFIKYFSVFAAAALLFREWLRLIALFHFPQRERVAALVGAFLIAQLLWATALLPIGFLNSANLMLLCTFVIAELLVNYFKDSISRDFLRLLAFVFAFLFLLIYWTSSWTLH